MTTNSNSMIGMSAAPLGETLKPASAYITIVIPVSDAARAIRSAHEYARRLVDATVSVTAPDGSVLCAAAVTVDGAMPRPSICTALPNE